MPPNFFVVENIVLPSIGSPAWLDYNVYRVNVTFCLYIILIILVVSRISGRLNFPKKKDNENNIFLQIAFSFIFNSKRGFLSLKYLLQIKY